MRKIATIAIAGLLALASFAGTSAPTFVGKGDVQQAFGWNNKQLQENAGDVTFSIDSVDEYLVTIEFSTGNPDQPKSVNEHVVSQSTSTSISGSVTYDPRGKKQVTGFTLVDSGATSVQGTLPAIGDPCNNGNLNDCVVTDVEPASSTGGLYAHFGEASRLLP